MKAVVAYLWTIQSSFSLLVQNWGKMNKKITPNFFMVLKIKT
jgi:hypothetical protein